MTQRVMVAMSGGVDSAVTALVLQEAGYELVGVTLKLWGGESDSGCCSVSDVDDARRVADHLGIEHHVFNFGEEFTEHVVDPYVHAHQVGLTPNPCIECNRHLKFDKLLARAELLGFDFVATGHHARLATAEDGSLRIARGVDMPKDQSYVLYMLQQAQLQKLLLPIGHMTKEQVRARAAAAGIRVATKPDSQDVCFISKAGGGRQKFIEQRVALHPGVVVDMAGHQVGSVSAVELVTIGQRKGLGLGGPTLGTFAVEVDVPGRKVTVGSGDDLLTDHVPLTDVVWTHDMYEDQTLLGQGAAHGQPLPGHMTQNVWHWEVPQRRLAPGQSVVFYMDDAVVGGGVVDR